MKTSYAQVQKPPGVFFCLRRRVRSAQPPEIQCSSYLTWRPPHPPPTNRGLETTWMTWTHPRRMCATVAPVCRTRDSNEATGVHYPCRRRVGALALLTTCELVGARAMPKLRVLIFAATAILTSPAYAETCPAPITRASRLVLVTTQSMDTALATLQLFTRPSPKHPLETRQRGRASCRWQSWPRLGYPFLNFKEGEEPEKVEGDNRTPAGFFRIGPSFGFAPSRRPGYIELKSGETVCVEDPSSPFYNTITKRSDIGSVDADHMRSSTLYRRAA